MADVFAANFAVRLPRSALFSESMIFSENRHPLFGITLFGGA
jgi:hypothetical protein